MGRTHVANLTCPHCSRSSTVPCQELDEANTIIMSLKRLIAESKLPFFETDPAGIVTSWRDGIAEALGTREQDAMGQSLEDVVAERYRARVTHVLTKMQRQTQDKNNAEINTIRVAGKASPEGSEVSVKTVGFYSTQGHFLGSAGLAQLDAGRSKTQVEKATLPRPVGGVSAFRCTLKSLGVGIPSFEICQLSSGQTDSRPNGNNEEESFSRLIEKAARTAATSAVLSQAASTSDRPVPFQSELLPFETGSQGTRYYSVRGVATNGPEMPFGGGLGFAEGYAIDITALKNDQQEANRWHDRWRALALLSFHFVFLVDITEYRVLRSWGDQETLGVCIEGRPLWDCIPKDERSSTINAISTAMSDTGGSRSHELVFRHRSDDRPHIRAQCVMLSDSGDPSLLFLGAQVVSGGSLGSDEAAGAGRVASSSFAPTLGARAGSGAGAGAGVPTGSGPELGTGLPTSPGTGATGSPSLGDRLSSLALEASSNLASVGLGGGARNGLTSASSGKVPGSGLKLTAAALSLAAGLPAPPPGLGRTEALLREAEKKNSKLSAVAAAAEPVKVTTTRPPVGGPPPPGEAHASPQQRSNKKATTGRKGAGSNTSRSPRSARVPRVFPTRIVVRGEDGQDLWTSNELLLGENMRAAELMTIDSSQRFSMPQHLADALQADTHDLFVLDSNTSELLQIANLARTNLQSLQKHCETSGLLTLVICPAEGSEDAFETIPAKRASEGEGKESEGE